VIYLLTLCCHRYVQLAGDAQSVVAMTDDEKKRVDELLADLDSLQEIPEENSVDEVSIWGCMDSYLWVNRKKLGWQTRSSLKRQMSLLYDSI